MQSSYYTPGKLFGVKASPSPTPAPKAVAQPVVNKTPQPVYNQPAVVNKPTTPQLKMNMPTQPVAKTFPVVKPQPVQTNPNGKIFTGNLLQKGLDVISLPLYAGAGFLKGMNQATLDRQAQAGKKGKSLSQVEDPVTGILRSVGSGFAHVPEAVSNRETFSSNDTAGQYGITNPVAKFAANLGADLAVPSVPLGRLASMLGKGAKYIPGVADAASKASTIVSNFAKTTPFIYKAAEVVNPYFRNPEAGTVLTQTQNAAAKRVSDLYQTLRSLTQDMTPEMQARVGRVLEGNPVGKGALTVLERKAVDTIRPIIRSVGKEVQDLGYLSEETIKKFKRGYMPHIFEDTMTNMQSATRRIEPGVSGTFFKKRKGAEGYIQQFAPAVFKGIGTEMKDIEAAKGYREIAQKFGETVAKGSEEAASNFIKNEKIRRMFQTTKLPNEIIDYINRTKTVDKPTTYAGKAFESTLNYWKAAKTIYNPAYHIRNLMSNQILSDMSTGRGIPRTLTDYVRAVANYRGKGDQRIVKAAEDAGIIRRSNFYSSLDEFLQNAGFGKKTGIKGALSKVNDGVRQLQQVTEDTAKLSVFKTWVQKGADAAKLSYDEALKTPEILQAAAKKAEEAIFSPYNISAAERSNVGKAFPFYSFTRQALPFTAKTVANNPNRITKYYRAQDAVEQLSPDNGMSRDQRPDNMQNLVRLPGEDQQGRQRYFDPSYILPWGNFLDPGGSQGKLPFGLSFNPIVSEAYNQASNYDPYTGSPIADSNIPEVAAGQRAMHAVRTFEPAAVTTLRDKVIPAFQGQKDYAGRTRSPLQSVVDAFGLKTQKVSPAELRSRVQAKDVASRRSFQLEADKIRKDPNKTSEQKTREILRLREVYQSR